MHILFLLLLVFFPLSADASVTRGQLVDGSERALGTSSNPIVVTCTGGSCGGVENNTITGDFTVTGSMSIGGDTTISGTLQASAANILGADEVMSFSDGNSIDGNKNPGYITIDDLMVTSSDTTLGNAFRVQNSALATKFTVLSNGNVGIGTTNPSGTFSVTGAYTLPSLFVASTGNVGIGTYTPEAALKVVGSAIIGSTMSATSTRPGVLYTQNIYMEGGSMAFRNSASSVVAIVNQTGNIGIGTITPGTSLDVNGSITSRGIAAISGSVTVCVDTTGKFVKSATACSGY